MNLAYWQDGQRLKKVVNLKVYEACESVYILYMNLYLWLTHIEFYVSNIKSNTGNLGSLNLPQNTKYIQNNNNKNENNAKPKQMRHRKIMSFVGSFLFSSLFFLTSFS